MSLNRVILIGRLTKDPETRTTQSGVACANFTLAADRRFKSKDGERETDFINCVAWRKTAELIQQYCSKGMKVCVDGALQVRRYEAQDGSKRTAYEVVADNVQFFDKGKGGGQGKRAQTQDAPPDDYESEPDLPF